MSTIKVNKIENTATADGGVAIDVDGHVTIDGQQLPTAGPLSNRNMIINGAMQIAQRGTTDSVATADGEFYLIDRFFHAITGTAVTTYSQSTEAPAEFTHSLKLDVTTADTDLSTDGRYKIEHRIEGLNSAFLKWGTANAKTVTLSFWIRSNLTGNTQVSLVNFGNDRSYCATFSIDSANTWEKKTITVPGDTSGTWLTNNSIGIRLRWGSFGTNYQTSSVNQWISPTPSAGNSRSDSPINFASSTDNELYLTGVQLEVGSKSTPFEHRSYADELDRCWRYYQRFNYTDAQYQQITILTVPLSSTSTTGRGPIYWYKEMRATPDCDNSAASTFRWNGGGLNDQQAGSISIDQISKISANINCADSTNRSRTSGYSGWLSRENFATTWIEADAEL